MSATTLPGAVERGEGVHDGASSPAMRSSASPTVVVVLLMLSSFAVSYWIHLALFDLRVFYNWDVWFQSDPNVYLDVVTRSNVNALVAFRHPLVGPTGWVVTGAVADLLLRLGIASGNRPEVQIWAILLVVPVIAAFRTLVTFDVVRKIGGGTTAAALVCVLDMIAFASVTVGSVPETYPISAACVVSMIWLVLDDAPRARWMHPAAWLVTGAIAVGVTLTNGVALVSLLAAWLYRRRTSLVRSAVMLVAAPAVALACGGAVAVAGYGRAVVFGTGLPETQDDVRPVAGVVAKELTWSVAHTFVAPLPVAEETWATPAQNPEYDMVLSYSPPYRQGFAGWWRALLTVAIVALGLSGHWRGGRDRDVLTGAIVIVAANVMINMFFGDHFVLYEMHWQTSMVWFVAGLARPEVPNPRVSSWILAGFVVVTAVNSLTLLERLLELLRTA